MINEFNAFFVDENTIRNFIKKYGKGYKKDHEIAIAVQIKKLFENKFKKEFCIAFELKEPLVENEHKPPLNDLDKINIIIRNATKKDTPIDIFIVEGNPINHSPSGFAFQLKWFGLGIRKNFLDNLLNYLLIKIPIKYSDCGEVALIIAADLDENLEENEKQELMKKFDWENLRSKLKITKYPFKKIFILTMDTSTVGLIEVWPGKQYLSMSR